MIPGPDSPADLINAVLEAAARVASPQALGPTNEPTAYGEIAREQLAAIVDQFTATPGSTIEDAWSFIFAARRILSAFNLTALAGVPNWKLYGYGMALLDRGYECLHGLSGANPPPPIGKLLQ